MGQKITLLGEDYYVIENSDSTVATVKLLAAIPIELTQYRQTSIRPAYPRYDDDSGNYETSEIKVLVDSYKAALEARMHKTLTEARLLDTSEARTLNLAGYTDIVYGTYDTDSGKFNRSMNKMGGVLDYNFVIGLCMNTVKAA